MIAEYEFYENPVTEHTGVFKGILRSDWYLDKNNNLNYDDLSLGADGFFNNQFVGNWASYKAKKPLICNWGDFRIPYSDDLDVGTAEFAPSDKYLKYGWENYKKAFGGGYSNEITAAAVKLEKKEWWK